MNHYFRESSFPIQIPRGSVNIDGLDQDRDI
jgi:hypothetical protein